MSVTSASPRIATDQPAEVAPATGISPCSNARRLHQQREFTRSPKCRLPVFVAGGALVRQEAPENSVIGMKLGIASPVVMPVLFLMKYRLGRSIRSKSLVADSKETLACLFLPALYSDRLHMDNSTGKYERD